MFNNHFFRTSSTRTNYFYDLIRGGNFDKEKFKEDYLNFYNRIQASSTMVAGLDFLLSFPQIINDLVEFKYILSNYNLKFDDVLKFDRSFYSNPGSHNPLRQHIIDEEQGIKHSEISQYKYMEARNFLQYYDFDLALLKQMGDEDQIEIFGHIYTKENLLKTIEEKKPKVENAKKTVETFKKNLEEQKSQQILLNYNHTFTQIENAANQGNQLIKKILGIVGESNIKSIKYLLKDLKFLDPLFNRSSETPVESEKVEENENVNNFNIEKSNLSKDDFVNDYLQNHALPFSNENKELLEKVETIWGQVQKDNNFLSKCAELKKVLSETFGSEKIDINQILHSIDRENKKFKFKKFQLLDYKWYLKQIEFLEANEEAYLKAKNFDGFVSDIRDKANIRSQISQNKIIIKEYEAILNIVKMFKDKYLEWAKDIIIEPSGKSLADLSFVFEKINKTFISLPQLNYFKSEFINNYLEDDRLDSFFGETDNLSAARKFEIILENYIKIDRKKRVGIVKKLTDPIALRRILKNEFPDLLRTLVDEKFIDKKGNLFDDDLYLVKSKLIKSMNISSSELREIPSKYFSEFNLNNSSEQEKILFNEFEKLGLHAIPATQTLTLKMKDDDGIPLGFRIDFLLPCNVRVYDDNGNYSLREDIIFIGEYFGFYGEAYDQKTERKSTAQNMLERTLDQRCLHIKDKKNLCPILMEKNIDSKCYSDYKKSLYDIENTEVKKRYFIKSQLQHFMYVSLISELMWHVDYNNSQSTIENYDLIKRKNIGFIDAFENLLQEVNDLSPIELRRRCSKILSDYKASFESEKLRNRKMFKNSARYNIRIK
jgi:hypothetical protein